MRRFEARWREWDDMMRGGASAAEVIADLSDSDLVQLLAGGDPGHRRYELNLLASEALNRLHQRANLIAGLEESNLEAIGQAADDVSNHVGTIVSQSQRLKETGSEQAADGVKDAATDTLRAVQEAEETTREHAEEVQAEVRRMRLADDDD